LQQAEAVAQDKDCDSPSRTLLEKLQQLRPRKSLVIQRRVENVVEHNCQRAALRCSWQVNKRMSRQGRTLWKGGLCALVVVELELPDRLWLAIFEDLKI